MADSNLGKEATIARARQIVDVLGSRHVRDGWRFDEVRAAQFLDAVHECLDGDQAALHAVALWMKAHGQSMDWLFEGDASGLICKAAAHSEAA
jgi:hypothetical protein